jgi:hypothetical protein
LTVFPLGGALFIVLRRYSHYEGRKLDAEMKSVAAREYNEQVFAAASRPLVLLGSAYRFSADPRENAGATVRSGAVRLKTRDSIAPDGDPVKARWIEPPGIRIDADTRDSDRQDIVARWLFSELLSDLANAIRALPPPTNLEVCLWPIGELSQQAYVALWRECWAEQRLPPVRIADLPTPAGISVMDGWLDPVVAGALQVTRLIVAVQLHPIIGDSPPSGTAEAGVALLLAPDVLAHKHDLVARASLHRPVRRVPDQSAAMLVHALKWASVTAEEVPSGWKTGLNAEQGFQLGEAAFHLRIEASIADLDQAVGHAGAAAPWLALACGVDALSDQAACQILVTAEQGDMVATVLRRSADNEVAKHPD